MFGSTEGCFSKIKQWTALFALCAGMASTSVVAAESDALYCVIDLSGGANASSYPVTYLDAMPTGGWTDEYKTTKLVLRRIEAGTFKMQNVQDVTLTRAFYMGVFEVTQKQYELVTGTNPSKYAGSTHPVERVSWNKARGASTRYNWPTVRTVDADSFVGRIRARTKLAVDLPTYAQWQYACRAGTDELYNRESYDTNTLDRIARWEHNRSSEQHAVVGSYTPNAWGLYDMIGNVGEWCLDWYSDELLYGVNPVGAENGEKRIFCGGTWWTTIRWFSDFTINKSSPNTDVDDPGDLPALGIRLVGNTVGEVDSLRITALSVDTTAWTATLTAVFTMAKGEPDPLDFKVRYSATLDETDTQIIEPISIPDLDRANSLVTLTVKLPEGELGFMRVVAKQ